MKIMHELLYNEDIVSNVAAPHEGTLFWIDEMGKKIFHPTNHTLA